MQHRQTATVRKLVLSTQGRLLREIVIDRRQLTIGRRPYNDVALDHLTVSGEHAVLHSGEGNTVIHDLRSRNGTLVNGEPVMQRVLLHGDEIDIGVYRLQLVLARLTVEPEVLPPAVTQVALLRTLNGAAASGPIALERPITSVGNSGASVAVVARRRNGYFITHLEGLSYPLVNGEPIGLVAHPLVDGDLIELAGTIYQFQLAPR
jgi:pSer/pThr/pTyr-binding forkhead associated (FHA) protein